MKNKNLVMAALFFLAIGFILTSPPAAHESGSSCLSVLDECRDWAEDCISWRSIIEKLTECKIEYIRCVMLLIGTPMPPIIP